MWKGVTQITLQTYAKDYGLYVELNIPFIWASFKPKYNWNILCLVLCKCRYLSYRVAINLRKKTFTKKSSFRFWNWLFHFLRELFSRDHSRKRKIIMRKTEERVHWPKVSLILSHVTSHVFGESVSQPFFVGQRKCDDNNNWMITSICRNYLVL